MTSKQVTPFLLFPPSDINNTLPTAFHIIIKHNNPLISHLELFASTNHLLMIEDDVAWFVRTYTNFDLTIFFHIDVTHRRYTHLSLIGTVCIQISTYEVYRSTFIYSKACMCN